MNFSKVENRIYHIFISSYVSVLQNNGKSNLGKFDSKYDESIFLGYSQSSKDYRDYNKRLLTVEESVYVTFDESYMRNVGEGILSSKDLLKDTEEEINYPEAVKLELEEEDEEPVKEKEKSPTEEDNLTFAWNTSKDHSFHNIL